MDHTPLHMDSLQIDEALWNYLLEKSGQAKDLAIETGYNLKDGCTKMAHEYGISIFTKILDGEVGPCECVCVCV